MPEGTAALPLLCGPWHSGKVYDWRAGLQESQPGFSVVAWLIMPGDPVLSHTTAPSPCTQMSLPLTPLSRVMESRLFVTI